MAISEKEAVKELQTRKEIFVAYSQATNLPYVTCDEESFNDQAWVFATEEEIKAYGKKLLDDKILIMGMKYENKNFPRFYGMLYGIGVNSVVWNDGENKIEVELSHIAKQADMSKAAPEKRPLLNPTLQLCGIYFMQALRRPVSNEERGDLRALEEEFVVNFGRSEFLMAMTVDGEDSQKVNIPYLKNKDGKILHPIFSDVMEFQKFAGNKKFRMAKVPAAKLSEVMISQAEAFVLNPMGLNLVLGKEQLKRILG